ncbi:hypothetical protein [Lentzea kentuckyensis]|uniref:nSTAND1 domain-containing NTPase n=1 Tax=Lentzea kentuckyensis TaxID=360086 RepID=UPI000A373A9D|nr:hypothetical protein [Lentzea kentuckyensis]
MPRPERPLDSDDDELLRFAADLRLLREKAGKPTYRELSKAAHYSVTMLSEAASGRKLPSLAVTTAYVHACGGDVEQWRRRWHEVAEGAKPADPDREPPYLGLGAFQAADASRFFGREKLVGQLLEKVRERPFVGVFGASGSGKSSLLRAGLVASRPAAVLTPGPHPLAVWGEVTADLVVIDQFEELFTLCRDEDERVAFLDAITSVAGKKVVIGVRSDFYGHCGRYPQLVDALHDAQILVGAMSPQELRRAITEPALRAGYTVEGALVSVLEAEHAPLPLVSHALLETWRRRRGTRLTVAGYEETGGVRHALAQSAEAAYLALDAEQQAIARKIFLRLTALGEGTEDTKRRVNRDSLDNDDDVLVVLDHLARARLITLDDTGVDLTHEAVIRSWPRLSGWLTANRDGLRVHHQLTEATATWESLNRDSGALYRGVRLAQAREWATGDDDAMSARERQFLKASVEAEEAEQETARRTTRRLRQLVGLLTVLLVLAVTAVGYAITAEREATTQRNLAIAHKAVTDAKATQTVDATLALQLGLGAHDLVDDGETRDNVLSAQSAPYFTRVPAHDKDVTAVAVAQGMAATVSWDGTAKLWDISDTTNTRELGRVTTKAELNAVDLSKDGRRLAFTADNAAPLYDVSDPRSPRAAGVLPGGAASVEFSADGLRAVTALADGTTRLWDVGDLDHPREIASLPAEVKHVKRATFSPDGRFVAVGEAKIVTLWDVTGTPVRRGTLSGHTDLIESIAFSPDGTRIATGGWDHVTRLWDVRDPAQPVSLAALTDISSIVWGVAFSPDGTMFAATGNLTTQLWNVTEPRPRKLATIPGGVYAAEFTPDSGTLVISEGAKAMRLQRLRDLPLAGHQNNVSMVTFRRDGEVLASSSWDGTAWLWRMTPERTREPLAQIGTDSGAILRWLEFNPDGTLLALASDDGFIRLYDVRDARKPLLLRKFDSVFDNSASVTFSPDGRTLAVGGNRVVSLWNVTNPAEPVKLSHVGGFPNTVWSVAFTPDGGRLMASTGLRSRIFDVADPTAPRELPFLRPADGVPRGGISADGRYVAAVVGDREIVLLDGTGQRELGRLTGFERNAYTVAFHGDRMATAHADHLVRYWDIGDPAHPRLITTFTGHTVDVGTVAVSPDGSYLASGSNDTTIRLWDVDVSRAIARMCGRRLAPMTRERWEEHFPDVPYRQVCR